jgi:hypothetical protein
MNTTSSALARGGLVAPTRVGGMMVQNKCCARSIYWLQ